MVNDFSDLAARLEGASARLQACGDRICGMQPPSPTAAGKEPEAISLLDAIQMQRGRLVRALDFLESEINRIDSNV